MRTLYLITTVLILATLGIGYFVIYPAYTLSDARSKEIVQLDAQLTSLKKTRDLLKKLASQPLLKERSAQAKAFMPVNEEREAFTSQVDELAKSTGLTLSTFTFKDVGTKKKTTDETKDSKSTKEAVAKKAETVKPLGFALSVTGAFSQIEDLLNRLRRLPRYVVISSTALTSNDSGITATIEGVIYTKAEPKDRPKLDLSIENWEYLNKTETAPVTVPTTGRVDPFAAY